jgi:tRNA 5-methylaminomethyl-2-thiouridine biosynthesis bifunctional protein
LPKTVAIVGAGLAGSACANAFALAGFRITVFEQGASPAAGASGVPLAMFAPSVSADDAPHSRLLREGVHLLMHELQRLTQAGRLVEGIDWALTGVVERCIRTDKKLPSTWLEPQDPPALQSRVSAKPSAERYSQGDAVQGQELLHGAAGWVRPDRLIAAWLDHPLIKIQTQSQIEVLKDSRLAAHDVVVLATGYQTPQLLPHLQTTLQPIRGQVEWGSSIGSSQPINGMGHWIEGSGRWLAGATFQRDEVDLSPQLKDVNLNFEKLATLRTELEPSHLGELRSTSQSWVGVRTAQKNRVPMVTKITDVAHPNLWVCSGLGSRGLSLAAQCAQTLLQKVIRDLH